MFLAPGPAHEHLHGSCRWGTLGIRSLSVRIAMRRFLLSVACPPRVGRHGGSRRYSRTRSGPSGRRAGVARARLLSYDAEVSEKTKHRDRWLRSRPELGRLRAVGGLTRTVVVDGASISKWCTRVGATYDDLSLIHI